MSDGTSSDDIIDERIRALTVGHFNAPDGEPPRQAMWEGIAAARAARRAADAAPAPAPDIAPLPSTIVPIAARRSHAAAWRWGAALAAGLVLGIVVDRRFVHDTTTPVSKQVADNRATPPVTSRDPAPSAPSRTTQSTTRRDVAAGEPKTRRMTPPASAPVETTEPRSFATRGPVDSAAQVFYKSAAAQTLVQAEALLTAYRADQGSRDPQAMLQAARWARDVLSSTRLLIDSPAGRDPQMRALFNDLELVLAQLVQLSGTPLQANERELIERAMRDRDLLPRLRSAVPAGLAAS